MQETDWEVYSSTMTFISGTLFKNCAKGIKVLILISCTLFCHSELIVA